MTIDEAIRDFESALERTAANATTHSPKLIADFGSALSRLASERGGGGVPPSQELFDRDLSKRQKRIIAAGLVRLMALNDRPFQDVDLSHKSTSLFDEVFDATLYRKHGVTTKSQTFNKHSVLRGLPADAEAAFLQAIEGIPQLRPEASIKHGPLKAIKSQEFQDIIAPFIPDVILNQLFPRCLEELHAVSNAEGADLRRGRAALAATLDDLRDSVHQSGSHLVKSLFDEVIVVVGKRADDYYAASPLATPAELILEAEDKRYPLLQEGAKPVLRLRVVNRGPGVALDVRFEITDSEGVLPDNQAISLGDLTEGAYPLACPVEVMGVSNEASVVYRLAWEDVDGDRSYEAILTVSGQPEMRDWEALKWDNPYGLEPVFSSDELVGRTEVLGRLRSIVRGRTVGNAIITGQKRVGKTSVVRAFEDELRSDDSHVLILFREAGEFRRSDSNATSAALAETLGSALASEFPEVPTVAETAAMHNGLASLTPQLEALERARPETRVVVIIDEFDELPTELLRRGAAGETFFLALRSLAGRRNVGFILVGGQRMDFVVDAHGQALNKFSTYRISYFDRVREWDDYRRLVSSPSEGALEFSESAHASLYEITSGHPFYTKVVCQALYDAAIERRDMHITEWEVEAGALQAILDSDLQQFSHFWDDGIWGDENEREQVSLRRRKLLVGLGSKLPRAGATLEQIEEIATQFAIRASEAREELRAFQRRGVLTDGETGIRPVVSFFERWLLEYGVSGIVTTLDESDEARRIREAEEAMRVSAEELVTLVSRWAPYRGQEVTTEDVRAWLSQFEGAKAQRLMYVLLTGVTFCSDADLRAGFAQAYRQFEIEQGTADPRRQAKRQSVLVSHFGTAGKSGASMARKFALQNHVHSKMVVHAPLLPKRLEEVPDIRGVFIVDDFIGSGQQAMHAFREEFGTALEAAARRQVPVRFCAGVGHERGRISVARTLSRLQHPVELNVAMPYNEDQAPFHEDNPLFGTAEERDEARSIARLYGKDLHPKYPLGYGGLEVLVVFSDSCPNNTLPIIWSDSAGWRPLFRREG